MLKEDDGARRKVKRAVPKTSGRLFDSLQAKQAASGFAAMPTAPTRHYAYSEFDEASGIEINRDSNPVGTDIHFVLPASRVTLLKNREQGDEWVCEWVCQIPYKLLVEMVGEQIRRSLIDQLQAVETFVPTWTATRGPLLHQAKETGRSSSAQPNFANVPKSRPDTPDPVRAPYVRTRTELPLPPNSGNSDLCYDKDGLLHVCCIPVRYCTGSSIHHFYVPRMVVRSLTRLGRHSVDEAIRLAFQELNKNENSVLTSYDLEHLTDQHGTPWSSFWPNEPAPPRVSEVTEIRIGKLPYQEQPYVYGVRDGKDVYLLDNGQWSEDEESEQANIPLQDGLAIVPEPVYDPADEPDPLEKN
jgi:hypothetical protein